jgi:hypothetical protein
MDLALSRLRLVNGQGGCSGTCPDQELFERLVSELAVSMAPPVDGPARTVGPRALQLSFDTTVTSIEAHRAYWALGTEGDGSHGAEGYNASPQSALVFTRVQARKGLPFGLEAGATLGRGLGTSLWTLGLALKWALFEGFRTGLGRLPDVAVQGAVNQSVGSSQASVRLYIVDLTLSKPFVVQHTWSISPFTGLQLLFARVESGVVDITPGVAAVSGDGSMASADDVVFKTVSHTRARMFVGGQARYQAFTLSLSALFDLATPSLAADPIHQPSQTSLARQIAFNVAVGAVL